MGSSRTLRGPGARPRAGRSVTGGSWLFLPRDPVDFVPALVHDLAERSQHLDGEGSAALEQRPSQGGEGHGELPHFLSDTRARGILRSLLVFHPVTSRTAAPISTPLASTAS